LANIALHGLEEYIKKWAETWEGKKKSNRNSISLIRYADDFVVLHKDKSVIQEAKQRIEQWLNGLGLELKESKTKVCHSKHDLGNNLLCVFNCKYNVILKLICTMTTGVKS